MKALFFFLGSAIRWMGSEPRRFVYFHLYLFALYLVTLFLKNGSSDIYRFIFTLGVMAPFLIAIYKGLPLNCLDLDEAIKKELVDT